MADAQDTQIKLSNGLMEIVELSDGKNITIKRHKDKASYTFMKSQKTKDYQWYKTTEKKGGEKLETEKVDLSGWQQYKLRALYIEGAIKTDLIKEDNFKERCNLLLRRMDDYPLSAGAKTGLVVGSLVLGALGGVWAHDVLTHGNTNPNAITVDKWHNQTVDKWNNVTNWVNTTKWNNQTKYIGNFDALKADVKSKVFDAIDNATIEANWGTNTTANVSALENILARDGIADVLTADKSLWADIQAIEPTITKTDLYFKTWGNLASIIKQAGFNSGFDAGKSAADAVVSAFYDKVSNDGKIKIPEFNATDWVPYSGKTIDNITAIENLIAISPYINSAFADHYISDYFSHTGLAKKAAYTDANIQTDIQNGIEYKFFAKQFDTNLTANVLLNLTGDARTNAINSLQYISANYNWLSGNYNKNITEELTDKIATNATLANSTLGKAILDASNFGADKVGAYKTADGAFIQTNGGSAGKAGKEGGYKISAAEYDLLKNL